MNSRNGVGRRAVTRYAYLTLFMVAALLLQLSILPAYILDPFQPNFIIILVVYLGLKRPQTVAAVIAFSLGILEDSVSGIYLGLHAFSYLCIYFLLAGLSDRLYTDNRFLLILTVLLGTVLSAALNLVLLTAFSVSNGIYASIFPAVIPQALVNALAASVIFNLPLIAAQEEVR